MLTAKTPRELVHRLIMAELLARPGEGLLARRFPRPRGPAREVPARVSEPGEPEGEEPR